jgi:hypothetical protein
MGGMIKTWSICSGSGLVEKDLQGIFLVFTLSVRIEHFWWIGQIYGGAYF